MNEFDPVAFQVLVPGLPTPFDSLDCADRARAAVPLEKLPRPVLDRLATLEASLVNARARGELARRSREELEAEIARLRSDHEAERERRGALEAERDALASEHERLARFLERQEGLRREEAAERRPRATRPRR